MMCAWAKKYTLAPRSSGWYQVGFALDLARSGLAYTSPSVEP